MAFGFGRFGKSRRDYPKLVTFFEATRMYCTRHLQATYFSPPPSVRLRDWIFNLPMQSDPIQSQKKIGVALVECYAFRTPGAFWEEFLLRRVLIGEG